MKIFRTNVKGITLITLVVTTIVLLILAGVTITMLIGNNGIINRSLEARQKTKLANEKEALQIAYIGEKDVSKLGDELLDKKIGNTNWKVLVTNNNVYGTNWIFVKKGTEIKEFGKLELNWLINSYSGEIMELKDGEFSIISATDGIAIQDHIIFNLDSSVIDGNTPNTKTDLESSLGKGVELKGFNFNDNSGLTNTSFKFDGNDDYIEMPFNKESNNFDGGLTLEFYGKILGKGLLRHEVNDSVYNRTEKRSLGGFFEIRNKDTNKGKMGLEFAFDDFEEKQENIHCNFGYSFSKGYSYPYIRKTRWI